MFSGHTCGLTMITLFLCTYTQGLKGHKVIVVLCWLLNLSGMALILLGHEHYTIDVLIGFFVAYFLFQYYHVFANNPVLFCQKQQDLLKQRIYGSLTADDGLNKDFHLHNTVYDNKQLVFQASTIPNATRNVLHRLLTFTINFRTESTWFPFFNYLEANSTGRFDFEFHWPFTRVTILHRATIKSTLCSTFTLLKL